MTSGLIFEVLRSLGSTLGVGGPLVGGMVVFILCVLWICLFVCYERFSCLGRVLLGLR